MPAYLKAIDGRMAGADAAGENRHDHAEDIPTRFLLEYIFIGLPAKSAMNLQVFDSIGGRSGTRTPDILLVRQAL